MSSTRETHHDNPSVSLVVEPDTVNDMEKAAVQEDGLTIPLIDFSKFLTGTSSQQSSTAAAILHGFQTAGFIYLSNIPITSPFRQKVFSTSASFFAQPLPTKLSKCWTTPEANRGYSAPGREKVSQLTDLAAVEKIRAQAPDIKESFEIGRDDDPDFPNRWPEEDEQSIEGFKETMKEFFQQCKDLHMDVMRAIAVGMSLPPTFFDSYLDVGDNTLRLLHYPAVDKRVFRVNPGQVRAGEHSDYGSITLLFQDGRGGLQVKSPSGKFVDAVPIEGTCVVNAGDLLARWSNDTIKSTIHRVVEPKGVEGDVHPARYSIAYFCNPNTKSFIEVLPGTYETEEEKKYPGVNSGEYLVQRLAATY